MTYKFAYLFIFALVKDETGLKDLHIVAFTHRNLPVSEIGNLHIETDNQEFRLSTIKREMDLGELMFLSTCNRVEFLFTSKQTVDTSFLHSFFDSLYPDLGKEHRDLFAENADVFYGLNAVEHKLCVASSVDSMIIGEREIITQVRGAYESCRKMGLTGDLIRIIMRHTIETA